MPAKKYLCSRCNETYEAEELIEHDEGSHEEVFGSQVWKPCTVKSTPCCGVEAEEVGISWWKREDN